MVRKQGGKGKSNRAPGGLGATVLGLSGSVDHAIPEPVAEGLEGAGGEARVDRIGARRHQVAAQGGGGGHSIMENAP